RPPVVADPRRARLLLRHGRARVVAAPAGRPAASRLRTAGGLRVRVVRARFAARTAARAAAEAGVLVLRARAAAVGPITARRPADRGRDDGQRAGDRALRRLPLLVPPVPRRRGRYLRQ